MTIGTLYQKRFGGEIEWRTGFLVQYASAAALFAVGAFATETMVVRWSGEFLIAVAWLVFGLSLGAIWLLYFLIRRQAAARVMSLFYLTSPMTALMAWLMFDERLGPIGARRHGGMRRRRGAGELAGRAGLMPRKAAGMMVPAGHRGGIHAAEDDRASRHCPGRGFIDGRGMGRLRAGPKRRGILQGPQCFDGHRLQRGQRL